MKALCVFFLPDGRVIEAEQGDIAWCHLGVYAYRRDTALWFAWLNEDHSVSTITGNWVSLLPADIPAEHRAYVLLNP